MLTATEILQSYLDLLGAAVMEGDFDTYVAGVALPFSLVTQEKEITITSRDSLREGFDAYHKMLKSQQATDMIRTVVQAELQNNQWLAGRYTTNILAGGTRIFDQFPSDIFLYCGDGDWQAVWIANDMRNTRWPIDLPDFAQKQFPPHGTMTNNTRNA